MHRTPKATLEWIERNRPPCERRHAFRDHECAGRSTMEHAMKYAGRQVNEAWAIIRLCARAHNVDQWQTSGGILDKRKNEYLALTHATEADLSRFPRSGWKQLKLHLGREYRGMTRER